MPRRIVRPLGPWSSIIVPVQVNDGSHLTLAKAGQPAVPHVTPSTSRRRIVWHLMVTASSLCGCDPISHKQTCVCAPTVLEYSTEMWLPAEYQNSDADSTKYLSQE